MKKIINSPDTAVAEMCRGLTASNPDLELIEKYKVIKKKVINKNKVSLISGGGSGHEPAHAGFVGKGMLDAAVCGDVFASPSQVQVYQAIKAAAGDAGTLLIIKNYSGDIMNFKNAAALAIEDGLQVEYIKVEDDVAVKDSLYTVGRRGVAGTVFVHKIAGAAAEQGFSLAEVKTVAQKTADNVRSIGFALSSCTVPSKGTPTFDIGEDEMEYGVGIHGEPGQTREKIIPADALAERMVSALLDDFNNDVGTDGIALLVNGFGAAPLMELYVLSGAVTRELTKRGISVMRMFVGNYMTSIDMSGASISILKTDEQLRELLNYKSEAPAFRVDGAVPPVRWEDPEETAPDDANVSYIVETAAENAVIRGDKVTLNNMVYILDKMSECIISSEVPFCELDSHAGDGDFGMSIAKGFRQLKREWKSILSANHRTVGAFLEECSLVIMQHCGGASGPIWGSAFRGAGKYAADKETLTCAQFAEMMQAALQGIHNVEQRSFGRIAKTGDKTLNDALIPCADSWSGSANEGAGMRDAFLRGAAEAVRGAKATESIAARMGRAGNVGERSIGYPDAGAHALGVIFTAIAQSLVFE